MRYFVLSDLHGSMHYGKQFFAHYEQVRTVGDKLLLLGDYLYHGPRNNLPQGYAPAQLFPLLNLYQADILAVRGNCDSEVDQMVLTFMMMENYHMFMLGSRRVFMTHGHIYDKNKKPQLQAGDVMLSGHTHVPTSYQEDGLYWCNPGSLSLPKEGSTPSYGILSEQSFAVYDLSGKAMLSCDFI